MMFLFDVVNLLGARKFMGSALTCPSSNYQGFGSKLHSRNNGPGQLCSGHKIVNSDIAKNIVKDAPSNISTAVADFDDLTVDELGVALANVVNIYASHKYQASSVSSSDQDESLDQNEIRTTGVNIHASSSIVDICDYSEYQSGSELPNDLDESSDQNERTSAGLHTNISENFCGAETLQSLDEVQVLPSVLDAIGPSSMTMHDESLSELTTTLVSALKGSRAQRGLPVTKLSVKWALDVYDPPITSESHTVKGHRRHSKSIKKDYGKRKNGKSKSLRSGGGEKKHASKRSSDFVDPRTARYEAAKGENMYDSPSLPAIPVLDYLSPELKCGASFYMEPFCRSHLPVAKAS